MGDHGDGFTAVAAEGEQERIQLLVIGHDLANDVFVAFHCVGQIHTSRRLSSAKWLVKTNFCSQSNG